MRILRRKQFQDMDAERRARIEFGPVEATKDDCGQALGLQWMDELRADLRLTFRSLRQNPGFASIAILSLALGIGANTAIFGLVDAVMLRLLPVREPERLVFVANAGTQGELNGGPPYPCFELLRDNAKSFEGMAAFSASNMELFIDSGREQVRGIWVSGNLYQLLGVKPLLGRNLSASDDQTIGKGGPDGPVAVISHAFWQQRFGGDPAVLGRAVRMADDTLTIVGVLPGEAMSLEPGRTFDIAVPMMLSDPASLRNRGAWWLEIVARLKPGVRTEQARAEANALFQAFMADVKVSADLRKIAFDHIELPPAAKGTENLRSQFSKPLTALMILVGLVLLAACANVANLMLARATARQREFAIRLAIGAGRGRLIRQNLTEALVLVAAGSMLGIALAQRGQTVLAGFFAEGGNRILLDLSLNSRLLLFTLTVSVLTGLAFGLIPALRAARVDPATGLQSGSRTTTGNRATLRLGRSLVILQVALSTVLLAGAGLFIRSLHQLQSVDLGFTREGVLTMEVTPERELFGNPKWLAMHPEILDRVRRIPGVRSASWATMSPFSGRDRGDVLVVPGFVPQNETDKHVHLVSVSADYFETFAMRPLLGRLFSARDETRAARVGILNETAARLYFGDSNPIGRTVAFEHRGGNQPFEIVGVIKDAKHDSLREQPKQFVYIPISTSIDRIGRLALSARVSGDPMAFAASVQKQVQSVRSTLLINNVATMQQQVERTLIRERLVSTLSIGFGAMALVLAAIGLYGILAYAVTRRTNEIGIRMALGATTNGVVWSILREALVLAGTGIVVGIPAVLALGSVTQALLYGVQPFDLPALVSAVLLLIAFAVIASIVPARRASRLDPISALRCE